jgi:hypothetical protein
MHEKDNRIYFRHKYLHDVVFSIFYINIVEFLITTRIMINLLRMKLHLLMQHCACPYRKYVISNDGVMKRYGEHLPMIQFLFSFVIFDSDV